MSDTPIDWTAKFNALPKEIRRIGSVMENRTRIQQLEIEKNRLRSSYRNNVDAINQHIKNCEKWIQQMEEEDRKAQP